MKKVLIALMALGMSLGILAGCATLDPGKGPGKDPDKTPLGILETKYAKVTESTKITETVEIKSGELLQYRSEKTYTGTESGYTLEETTKRMNDLDAEELYTETELPAREVAKAEFTVKLDLDELYFSGEPEIEGDEVKLSVLDDSVERVLGLAGELPAPVHGLKLSMKTDETHVLGIGIAYASGSSAVTITLTFAY